MKYYLVYDFSVIPVTIPVEKDIFTAVINAWKHTRTVYTLDTINAKQYYILDRFGAQRFIGRYAS